MWSLHEMHMIKTEWGARSPTCFIPKTIHRISIKCGIGDLH